MGKTAFKAMRDIEIRIRKIKDIKMIHIYELTGAQIQSENTGCVAVAVVYGNNQQINLSESDTGFQILIEKIYESYRRNRNVIVDEPTRLLLESGDLTVLEKSLQPYYQLEAIEQPIIATDSLLSKRFLPLVEYLAQSLYQLFDMRIQVVKREAGWRGACLLEVDVDGNDTTLYGKVTKMKDGEYSILVTNFLKPHATLLVNVKIQFDHLDIVFDSEILELNGLFTYTFKENKQIEKKEIIYHNKTIYYDMNEQENITEEYELPFGVQYVITREIINTADIETSYILGKYMWKDCSYEEIAGWTEVVNMKNNIRIKIRSLQMQQTLLLDGRIQTYFLEVEGNTSEKYREQLQGKYYVQ